MAKNENFSKRITTPEFRMSFPNLETPDNIMGSKDKFFSCQMLFDKKSNDAWIQAVLKDLYKQKWGDKKRGSQFKNPWRDGDTKAEESEMEVYQGQMMMNGMGALMQSGLTLSMADSFIAFPAARIGLGLLAQVDQKAKYMSTGNLNLVIDNPDELTCIIRSFSADPETEKMMASLTALANRTQEGGKTVDRIDAKLDATGKVFINAKDVTPMFFPPLPQVQPPQGATPPPAK